MSRLLPPVAMAPGNTRARSARIRTHSSTSRRPVPRFAAPRPADLGLGLLFAHTRDALVVGHVESGRIALWNPAAERLFGYSPEEAIGQPIDLLIPPAIARLHHDALAHYRRTGEGRILGSAAPMEVPALTRSGEEIRVELSLIPLEPSANGRRQYVLAMLRDPTDRNRADLQSPETARADSARVAAERQLHEQSDGFSSDLAALDQPLAHLQRTASRLA